MRIKNNSTYVNASGMQKSIFDFYTNDDAEMKLRHENEWYQRIYWQGVETFENHGYVIFDTFTYDDEHLPRLKHYFDESTLTSTDKEGNEKYFGNYGCFNREHFPKFMKDLRSALEYAGFDVKNNVKYVYTTEYGTERVYEDRRGTHVATLRPHYHLMLFVTDTTLTPAILNEYVGKLWSYGFHGNGKNFAELRRNTFHSGMNATDTKVRLRGLANYIGKYMHKSSEYEDKIMSRVKAIAYKMCPQPVFDTKESRLASYNGAKTRYELFPTEENLRKLKYHEDRLSQPYLSKEKQLKCISDWKEEWKITYNNAYKKIATFHGQSQHFGEYALVEPEFNIEEVAETGKMRMPDKQRVVKFIPIPLYYRRKLFYEQVMKDDGKLMWKLKDDDLSKTYYKNMTYRQSAIQADIYKNIYSQLTLADRIKVDSWMNGRNMNDLATYSVFFKDCYFDCDLEDIGTDEAIEIRLQQDFTSLAGNDFNMGCPMHRIEQNDRFDWKHFDDVLKVFEPYLEKRHIEFNKTFDKKEEVVKVHK